MAKIFTTVEKQWEADMILVNSWSEVDGSEKELFGTDAKVYGHRLRCSSDVRSRVCFSLCDDANVIVGSKMAIMYGLCFAATS